MIKEELLKYFNTAIQKKCFLHSYLIEVDESYDTSVIIDVIKQIIKAEYNDVEQYQNIFSLIDKSAYEDLVIIKPDGNKIKKEQILTLMNEYKTISLKNTNRFYVIEFAEDMNISASNTILKFLEEPEPNIVAFLITKNISSVLETIVSRCQIINMKYNIEKKYDQEHLIQKIELFKTFENKKQKSIVYLNELYQLKSDELSEVFEIWISIYMSILNNKTEMFDNMELAKIKDKMDKSKIIKNIDLLTESLELLKYNVNTRLILDRFFIGGE